jgi:hypothetical protein
MALAAATGGTMEQAQVHRAILDELGTVDVVEASGDSFYFFDPGDGRPVDQRFPFATLVTGDLLVDGSNVSKPGVFRVAAGVSGSTFRSLFREGEPEASGAAAGPGADDPLELDRIKPHQVYGRMHWVTALNPSEATWRLFLPLLRESYEIQARQFEIRPPPKV